MYLEIRYFYFIWKSDKTVCSRRGQFPLRGKGEGPLAQRSLPLRPPPETWGTPPVPHAPSWHKGAGLRSLPFGNPSQGGGGRGTRARPLPFGNSSRSWTGGAAAERGAGGVLFAPRCAPCPQMRRRTDLRFRYSAASRWVLDFVGSAYRPLLRMGELTALPVNSSLSVFSFDHE